MSDAISNALSQLVAVLQSARLRTKMYFRPAEPKVAEDWISGVRAGCSIFGLDWSPEDRRPALAKRNLELLTTWETDRLARRGLGPEEIVDELLAIEVEMWQRRAERTSSCSAGGHGLRLRRSFAAVSPLCVRIEAPDLAGGADLELP